jgi:hypothetical protein
MSFDLAANLFPDFQQEHKGKGWPQKAYVTKFL